MNIFITGVSSGLGRELTRRFLADGHRVWGISRRKKEGMDSSFLMNENFIYSNCDVGIMAQTADVYHEMEGRNFIPDVVILNAASQENDFLSEFSGKKFREIFNINFFGVFNWIEKFLPILGQKKEGIFIAISSSTAYYPLIKKKIAYPTSKAAINMLFEAFKMQYYLANLRFTIFNFGPLADKKPFLGTTYKEAANKVAGYIYYDKRSRVINYPFIHFLALNIIRLLPMTIIKKYILKN